MGDFLPPGKSLYIQGVSLGLAEFLFHPSTRLSSPFMLRLVTVLLLLLCTGTSGWAQPAAGQPAEPTGPVPSSVPAAQSGASPEPIRSTAEIRKMTPEQLKAKPRVDIEGIILDVPWKGFNGTKGVNPQIYQGGVALFMYVSKSKLPVSISMRMEPGDRVRIRGTAEAGNFSPLIMPESIEFLEKAALPEAEAITAADLSSGEYDGQWVSLTGVVQGIREPEPEGIYATPFHTLEIGTPHGGFRARIPADCPDSLLGSQNLFG
jgi:hypothetical protein